MPVQENPVVPKTYTQEQAFEASLKYFKGDDLAARVWVNKYALKDSDGNIYELTPKRQILITIEKEFRTGYGKMRIQ